MVCFNIRHPLKELVGIKIRKLMTFFFMWQGDYLMYILDNSAVCDNIVDYCISFFRLYIKWINISGQANSSPVPKFFLPALYNNVFQLKYFL